MTKQRLSFFISSFFALVIIGSSCNDHKVSATQNAMPDSAHACMDVPARFATDSMPGNIQFNGDTSVKGMVLIPAGNYYMGADNEQADPDEYPKHQVQVSSFYMDITEVTVAQFSAFVAATKYITTAEKKPDWEEMKKTVPAGTPKPADSLLVAASLVFSQTEGPVNLQDYSQWWHWQKGANWRQPKGPEANTVAKYNEPVVQVSWDDAMAYCKWAGKRLPTEAEWEYAARGGLVNNIYPWGNEQVNVGKPKCNSWEGSFPYSNQKLDGYITVAPVKSYAANGYGLYDMAGNVWEWCSDLYNANYYAEHKDKMSINPAGAASAYVPRDPTAEKRVLRGGSFLCNDAYCSGYRVARRMKSSHDTGLEHTGFRCVKDVK